MFYEVPHMPMWMTKVLVYGFVVAAAILVPLLGVAFGKAEAERNKGQNFFAVYFAVWVGFAAGAAIPIKMLLIPSPQCEK